MRSPPDRLPSPLVVIADHATLGEALVPRVESAVRGGARWVLLRAPGLETDARAALAAELMLRCPELFLSVHGDPEAARRAGAKGVHFPSRRIGELPSCGDVALRGASCHDAGEVERAEGAGAVYAFLSPVFAPTSKPAERPPLGVLKFAEIASSTRLPLVALGGMRPDRVPQLHAAGAAGVAVLGDLLLAEDITGRARQWVDAVRDAYGKV